MPTPGQAMLAVLSADATLMGYCLGGVYVDQAPEQVTNYLLFQLASDVRPKLMSGDYVGVNRYRWQVTGYFDLRSVAKNAKDRILFLLDGKTNVTLGGLAVQSSRVPDEADEGAADEDEAPRPGEGSGYRVLRFDVIWWL